jgi:hypothetical protein
VLSSNGFPIRGVSRCLSRRRRLENFNFFLSVGGGGRKFFSKESAAAAAQPLGLHLYFQSYAMIMYFRVQLLE